MATLAAAGAALGAGAAGTSRVSVDSAGAQADGASETPHISADGRVIAFTSVAANLVAGDRNGRQDVFVHDRRSGATERVSVAADGGEATAHSEFPSISADGRHVAYTVQAAGGPVVFVRDRTQEKPTRIAVEHLGLRDPRQASLSADGRTVALTATEVGSPHNPGSTFGRIVVRDLDGGTEIVRLAPDDEFDTSSVAGAMVSGNGRVVVFHGLRRTPWTPGVRSQIFAYDRSTRTVEALTPAAADGDAQQASVSHDGRHVAYVSSATGLVAGDTNGRADVFVHDRSTGTRQRASLQDDGRQFAATTTGAVGPDGRKVVFEEHASPVRIWLRDLEARTTERVDRPLPDRPISGAFPGGAGLSAFAPQHLSADGRFVVFHSRDDNLVEHDTNDRSDVFLRDRGAPPPELSVDDLRVREGHHGRTEARLTVTLAEPAEDDLSFGFATADGTATAGSDYEPAAGRITIPAGTASVVVAVPVMGDLAVEGDEAFTVTLRDPSDPAAVLSRATATVTIEDDDGACRTAAGALAAVRELAPGVPPVDCPAG